MSGHRLAPQVVAILRDHTDRGVIDGWAYCKCGWFLRDHTADAHRRHLADRLAAAGLLAALNPREQHQLRAKRVADEIMYRTGWPAPNAYELTSYLMLVVDEAPEGEA